MRVKSELRLESLEIWLFRVDLPGETEGRLT